MKNFIETNKHMPINLNKVITFLKDDEFHPTIKFVMDHGAEAFWHFATKRDRNKTFHQLSIDTNLLKTDDIINVDTANSIKFK